jgi:peptidoglycan hydrolase-like protein with peptidoglycan-binding domain
VPPSFASVRTRSRFAICLALLAAALAPASAGAAQHLGDRVLQQGARGHDVRVLQDYLTRVGFRTPIAGIFGPQTLRNVKRFQRRHRLVIDGVVGPQVVGALRKVAARRAAAQRRAEEGGDAQHLGDRVIKKGMNGQDVRVLQDYLTRAGIATPVDGAFGPTTLRSVRRFQREHGLTVDGIVGPQVVATLRGLVDGDDAGERAPEPSDSYVEPPARARLREDGTAVAPAEAPDAVKAVIAAGNRIASKPYRYGGGHARWDDTGYDCSGSVSYALHGAGLLDYSLDSTGFMSYGQRGHGRWITIYGHGSHAYMMVAGLRFDTSGANPSRWQTDMRSEAGYAIRHPAGL